ncbi:MAG: radical SAM protein [Candidatus Omnitrophica bacterium]|nr:radical SAM protein [Candidatus Omnitrophota bacterium]
MHLKKKIKVGTVQINNSFSRQSYFPYSVGLLQAVARKYLKEPDRFEFLLPIYSRISVGSALERLSDADIVVFSLYVWNKEISLRIAEGLKRKRKDLIIVFGGPQVPERDTESFLRCNPFIDIACHGEGETVFTVLLEKSLGRNWADVPSISYIDKAGRFLQTPPGERIEDLNKIPSPYLDGIFDPLMDANPQEGWVALWETNRGCPFSCTYCDWGSATKDKIYAYDMERLFREIDWFSRKRIEFIFCCDANFGILERDSDIVRYIVEQKKRFGYPKAFSIQNTKNFKESLYEMYSLLSENGLNKGISLSFQSLNEDTLRGIGRKNVSISNFKEVQQRLTSSNTETFTDIILGLPSETYNSFAGGVSSLIENGQHNRIQFNNLSILPNTEMGDVEYQKRFGFDIVEAKLINIHGSLTADSVEEKQQLVVGTDTMPKNDWIRARAFGWATALLHFDKVLQVVFVILNKRYSIEFRKLIEIFMDIDKRYPILKSINSFFIDKAADIQNGGSEFCESKEWLNIWWPADELILIKLCTEGMLDEFYKEAGSLIEDYLKKSHLSEYEGLLHESILLNRELIKLPFQEDDRDIHLSYNIWDVYRAFLKGADTPLKEGDYSYKIDRTSSKWSSWEEWCREVIWYGNKRGVYLYNVKK